MSKATLAGGEEQDDDDNDGGARREEADCRHHQLLEQEHQDIDSEGDRGGNVPVSASGNGRSERKAAESEK